MAKTKISEFDVDPSNNTDINSINIAEGCAPSGINNAIRQLMSDLKEFQTGASGDDFTVAGALDITGTLELDGSTGTSGQVLVSAGSGSTPTWGNAFVAGMIMLWSGSAASIPSGWLLCDGTNSTPNLRDRFVVGAGSTYAVGATGGTTTAAGAISGTVGGTALTEAQMPKHFHQYRGANSMTAPQNDQGASYSFGNYGGGTPDDAAQQYGTFSTGGGATSGGTSTGTGNGDSHTHSFSGTFTGTSGANLPPYYALCYIMKA
jgi:hypothetical protein